MRPDVSLLVIGFDNRDQCSDRIEAFRTTAKDSGLKPEVVLVNNGTAHLGNLVGVDRYVSRLTNLWAGPAIHEGAQHATAPWCVYLCSHHGRAVKPNWLTELLAPLQYTPGLSGSLQPIGCGPAALRLGDVYPDDDLEFRYHIQGGVWAATTEDLKHSEPHPMYPHGYEDVCRSWDFLKHGYALHDVPSIYSTGVRGRVCPDDSNYSYIHDYK